MKNLIFAALSLFISTSIVAQENASFERAVESYFSRVNRIGSIRFTETSDAQCPLIASAVVSASSYASPSRVMSYVCEACLLADDNGLFEVNDLECDLD